MVASNLLPQVDSQVSDNKYYENLEAAPQQLRNYPKATRPQLIERLSYILGEIQTLTGDIALAEVAGNSARIQAFDNSSEKSVQARDREASSFAKLYTNDLTLLRATRTIFEIERDFIHFILGEQNAAHAKPTNS